MTEPTPLRRPIEDALGMGLHQLPPDLAAAVARRLRATVQALPPEAPDEAHLRDRLIEAAELVEGSGGLPEPRSAAGG